MWRSSGTRMKQSYHTYEGIVVVMCHLWMRKLGSTYVYLKPVEHPCEVAQYPQTKALWLSCVTYQWVIAHLWTSRVTHMKESRESCVTDQWVMSHIWTSRDTRTNESHHTQKTCCINPHTLQHALQHTATHCNTLQHTATHWNILQRTSYQKDVSRE